MQIYRFSGNRWNLEWQAVPSIVAEDVAITQVNPTAALFISEPHVIEHEGSIIHLNHWPVYDIIGVRINGARINNDQWCWHRKDGWVSVGGLKMDDVVEVEYAFIPTPDLFIANWDPDHGNLLFVNKGSIGVRDKLYSEANLFLITDINEAKDMVLYDLSGRKIVNPKSGYYWLRNAVNSGYTKVLVLPSK